MTGIMRDSPSSQQWWPSDGSDEWLTHLDGILSISFLKEIEKERQEKDLPLGPVLEIGVWKGAWSAIILKNIADIQVFGVDPYPNLDTVRNEMLTQMQNLGVAKRFSLARSTSELPLDNVYCMIHIDGAHTEKAVTDDLAFAERHLADDGVIVVDDYRHFWFPGVASALYRSLVDLDLRIFAATDGKAFLAKTSLAEHYYHATFLLTTAISNLKIAKSWGEADLSGISTAYEQPSTVLGQQIALLKVESPLRETTSRPRFRRFVVALLPPVIKSLILKMLKFKK